MRVCEANLQILVMSPEGDMLKAKLPHRSEHPRALVRAQALRAIPGKREGSGRTENSLHPR